MLYQPRPASISANIRDNLKAIRHVIGPRKLLLAVKANAYGTGPWKWAAWPKPVVWTGWAWPPCPKESSCGPLGSPSPS